MHTHSKFDLDVKTDTHSHARSHTHTHTHTHTPNGYEKVYSFYNKAIWKNRFHKLVRKSLDRARKGDWLKVFIVDRGGLRQKFSLEQDTL